MLEPLNRPVLSEPLTWEQICERYPEQWVVLVEIDRHDEEHSTGFRTARVAGTGKTRRESFDRARPFERGYAGCANRFTGPITRPLTDALLDSRSLLPVHYGIPKPAFIVESLTSFWSPDASGEGTPLRAEPTLSEPLTWEQIRERYPDQWVVLVEMDWLHDKGFEFRTARVAAHGKTRGEPLEQARPLRSRYTSFCNFFTGTLEGSLLRLLS